MFISCKKSVQKTVPSANVVTLCLLYTTDRNAIVHSVLFEATATSALITALNHILIKSYSRQQYFLSCGFVRCIVPSYSDHCSGLYVAH